MSVQLFSILVLGVSGIIAQIILMRELLVSFYGNELIVGLILANWMIAEALGAYVVGKFSKNDKDSYFSFVILQVVFIVNFILSIFLARVFKILLGIPFVEAIGVNTAFWVSLFVVFPVSVCHGALFTVGCSIFSLDKNTSGSAISKVYALETIGTVIGAFALTYLLIPYLDSFRIAYIVIFLNIAVILMLRRKLSSRLKKVSVSVIALIVLLPLLFVRSSALQHSSIEKQWNIGEVKDYRNSVYGNIVVLRNLEQYTFFRNGIPAITTPVPDKAFSEELGNLALLFHDDPQDVLVIGNAAGGVLNEIEKHPVKSIYYAELDPLIIELVKKYPTELTEKELSDKRLRIINTDARFYLNNLREKLDVIITGITNPQDLSSNRFFTKEFFELVKNRLNPNGVHLFYLSGSITYLQESLANMNSSILEAAKEAFKYVRVAPGDYNLFFCSDRPFVMEANSDLLFARLKERGIDTAFITQGYLNYRFMPQWQDLYKLRLETSEKKVNRDLGPVSVFHMLLYWNRQFGSAIANALELFAKFSLRQIVSLMLIGFLLFFATLRRAKAPLRRISGLAIATTGFFSMTVNLALVFAYQVYFGYLYYKIGIFIGILMAGIAVGSLVITKLSNKREPVNVLIACEMAIIAFLALLYMLLKLNSFETAFAEPLFMVLFFVAGFLTGAEFPIAGKVYSANTAETAGTLYFWDLFGGWLAAIFGSVILLPVFGLLNSLLIVILVKILSLAGVGMGRK